MLLPGRGAKYRTPLSSRHLKITLSQGQLYLRHTGSNPTLIEMGSQWFCLKDTWDIWLDSTHTAQGVTLKLADVEVEIRV